jgi:hypothetical protein
MELCCIQLSWVKLVFWFWFLENIKELDLYKKYLLALLSLSVFKRTLF